MVSTNGCQIWPSFISYQRIYLECGQVSVLFDCGGQFLFDMSSHLYHNSTETEEQRGNLLQPLKSLQKIQVALEWGTHFTNTQASQCELITRLTDKPAGFVVLFIHQSPFYGLMKVWNKYMNEKVQTENLEWSDLMCCSLNNCYTLNNQRLHGLDTLHVLYFSSRFPPCPTRFRQPPTVCVNSSVGLTATAPSATSSPACSTPPPDLTAVCRPQDPVTMAAVSLSLCGAAARDTPTTGPSVTMATALEAQRIPARARRGLLEGVHPIR